MTSVRRKRVIDYLVGEEGYDPARISLLTIFVRDLSNMVDEVAWAATASTKRPRIGEDGVLTPEAELAEDIREMINDRLGILLGGLLDGLVELPPDLEQRFYRYMCQPHSVLHPGRLSGELMAIVEGRA